LTGDRPTYARAFARLMNAYLHSPNGATARAARRSGPAAARRAGAPSDLDRSVAPQLAGTGG